MNAELLEQLIAPVNEAKPSGEDLSWEPEFDLIKEARRADDANLSQGDWQTEVKTADWPFVKKQCELLIKTRSKDLQLAAWYAESLTYLQGFDGFAFGLEVLTRLLEQHWSTLYPDGPENLDARASKLEWVNSNLVIPLKTIPLTGGQLLPLSLFDWEMCQEIEQLGAKDPKYREDAVRDEKPTYEKFDKAIRQSGVPFYRHLAEQLKACKHQFNQLNEVIERLFGNIAPGMRELKKAIDHCVDFVNKCLRDIGAYVDDGEGDVPDSSELANQSVAANTTTQGPIKNRAQAIKQLRVIAAWFRDNEPHSPVPLLCERAAQWADMPLEDWLKHVVVDDGAMSRLRDMLGFNQ